jgi:nitrite reductase (NO-forming)
MRLLNRNHPIRSLAVLVALLMVAGLMVLALTRSGGPPADSSMAVPDDVPADKRFELVATSNGIVLSDGVVFEAMTFNETVPGPMLLVDEGDVVEIVVRNEDRIPHGLSVHAAHMNTGSRVGNILPGETKTLRFRATVPGVYMYHCAPGGHAIMTHTLAGMYGLLVVEPKSERYALEQRLGREPDLKLYFLQHEIYASGQDAMDNRPLYVAFNGENFRYVKDPIPARPGDYVRAYYLNVGPNLTGTFHLVGIVWDYMYYQGHPRNRQYGGQSTVAGPTDSWVVEFRVPEAGTYGIVTHAMGSQTPRGAMGMRGACEDAPRIGSNDAQGPRTPLPAPEETRRIVSTFGLGTPDVDRPVVFWEGDDVMIRIVNNSYSPSVARIPVGTTVTWVNEEAFDFLEGELTGKHNFVSISGPAGIASAVLRHAETDSHTFTERGDYE